MKLNTQIYQVATLKELGDWYGRSRTSMMMSLLAHEKITGRQAFRKSGGVFLVDVAVAIELWGRPRHPRPDYELYEESRDVR